MKFVLWFLAAVALFGEYFIHLWVPLMLTSPMNLGGIATFDVEVQYVNDDDKVLKNFTISDLTPTTPGEDLVNQVAQILKIKPFDLLLTCGHNSVGEYETIEEAEVEEGSILRAKKY